MLRFLFTAGFIFCLTARGHAGLRGQALIDSLLIELPKLQEDTVKVKVLNTLAFQYNTINPREAIKYGEQGLALAEKLSWTNGKAYANRCLGINYTNLGQYPEALQFFSRAMELYEQRKDRLGIASITAGIGIIYNIKGETNKSLEQFSKALAITEELGEKSAIASNCSYIGTVYSNQHSFTKALEYYFKALKIHQEQNNQTAVGNTIGNIGIVYYDKQDYDKALEFFLQALKIAEGLGEKRTIARHLGNIGNAYFSVGDLSKALEYDLKALKMSEEIGAKEVIAINTLNTGNVYSNQGNLEMALEYQLKALKMYEELGKKPSIASSKVSIGLTYLQLDQLDEAKKYLDDGIRIAEETGYLLFLGQGNSGLCDYYTKKKDFENALQHYSAYIKFRDSLKDEDNEKKFIRLEMDHEYARKTDSTKLENEKKTLALQKEMQLNALKYEYEKKQALIKTEAERKKLLYEEELKRNQINFEYEKKQQQIKEEQQRLTAVAQAEKEKNDAIAGIKLQKQKTYTYLGMGAAALLLGFSTYIFRSRKKLAYEKQRSEGLLLNILPSEIADELKERGATTAKHFDEVSVLFTDFVNFTKAGERMGEQQLIEELHNCFKAFDDIISRHHIEKIKTIGDAYLAVSGLPLSDSRHAENVVNAAMEIRAFMLKRRQQLGEDTFEIRIGIHSGPVVAGIVGVKKFAYDIWGDTVNTAARMEQKSEAGKINISETTHELVKDKYVCSYRGEIEAKNKGMMKMFFVEEAAN